MVFIADHGHASAGVGVSITTIPAASFIGVAAGDGNWSAAGDAAVVLVVNVVCVVVAGLATELVFRSRQQTVAQQQGPPMAASPQPAAEDDMIEQVKELSSLHESGVLTDDEFGAAKAKLFGS